jgi:hypothetical protein
MQVLQGEMAAVEERRPVKRAAKDFYRNLKDLYDKHRYKPSNIWNADESGCQAGRNGGGRVLAKVGT